MSTNSLHFATPAFACAPLDCTSQADAGRLGAKGVSPNGKELSRLINAAVVSKEFRELLLSEPAAALAAGYNGEIFQLTPEEHKLILSIRVSALADFAIQVIQNGRALPRPGE